MTEAAPLNSWAFWKKRLGRAAFVLGLGLLLTQILPAVPQDHTILYEAPEGLSIVTLDVTYLDPESNEALTATRIRPVAPADTLSHIARLPESKYKLMIAAELQDAKDITHLSTQERTLTLDSPTTRVSLTKP